MTEELKQVSNEAETVTGAAEAGHDSSSEIHGAQGAETLAGQAARVLTPPPAGQTQVVRLAPGERFEIAANPTNVKLVVDGDNLVLGFDLDGDGQADSFLVLEDLVITAGGSNPPVLLVAGEPISTDILIGSALAQDGVETGGPGTTLETAAGPDALGSGVYSYSDNLGDTLELLIAQGVIPPVELQFGLIELEDEPIIPEEENSPPEADPVLTPASQPDGGEGGGLPPELLTALSEVNTIVHSATATVTGSGQAGSVQYVFFTLTEPTAVTITTDGPTIDPHMFLFVDDGSLDAGDFLGSDDDGGLPAGLFFNSVINTGDEIGVLPAGNYIIAVGDYQLTLAEAVAGINNSLDFGSQTGDVTITIEENDPPTVVFFKQLDVDGSIGDDDSGVIADFGGNDAESSLENLVFTLQSNPTFGQLILVTAGGDTSYLTPGDTFSSEDTVWWVATEEQIANFLAQPGAPEFLPDVNFLYTVTDEGGASDIAPVVITLPPPTPPRAAVSVFEEKCLNEDTEGQLYFEAHPTDGASKISQIVLSGFPTGDPADAWVVDENSVNIFGYTLNIDYTASYDAATGELTITFITANFSLGETVSGIVDATPNPDSDVDIDVTIEATAINGAGSATDIETSPIPVDADADGAEGSAGDDGDGIHLSVMAAASDSNDDGDSFQPDEIGSLNIQATFDDFLDGSETHTIQVFAPTGFAILAIDEPSLPAGVTLVSNDGSIAIFDIETTDGVGAVDFDIAIQNTGAEEGTADFLVRAMAEETNTGDVECVDGGEGGLFPVAGDNVAFVEDTASVTVADIAPPEVSLSLYGGDDCIEEDSLVTDLNNEVSVTVNPDGDDLLTEIVITGLQADWTYDFSGLGGAGITVDDSVPGQVTITFDIPSSATYNGSFSVEPPADSDVDHPTITATASVMDPVDNTLTDSDNTTIDIHVDANADAGPGATGGTNDGDAEILSISIDDISDSGDAGSSFQAGESGTVTLTATFDDFLDGSETHEFTLTAPEGFEIDGINAASLPLPAGVTFDLALDNSSITFFMPTDSVDGLESLTVTLDITNVSAEEGSPTFEASATATETTTDDEECDDSDDDNIATVSVEQSVTVAGVAAPTVSINLENDASFIKEDSEDNLVEFAAATGDASDELTTVVITFPPEFAIGDLDFSSVAGHADVFDVDLDDSGGQVVVTITFDPAVTSFSGSFTLDAPVEDNDVDLGTISIVANVQDQVENSETDSANSSLQIDVDAVLDEALDPGADSDVDETEIAGPQTINLGLLATLGSAGFVNDPPVEGDSGSGGTDDDGSELISVVLVLDNPLPAGVTLSSANGTVTQDAGDATGKTYIVTGADLGDAIDGLQVELPGSFEGSITGTVTVTSMEANTPPGDVVPASGEEPDTSDNVVVLSADFDVTVEDGADPTGDELSLTVDEAALDLVQDGDDLAAGTTFGNDAGSTAETDSGGLTFNAGADPIVDIHFGSTGGIVVEDEDGNSIPVVWSGTDTDTLTGTLNGVTVIVLSLSGANTAVAGGTANVTVAATLTDAFPHDFGNTGDVTITGIEVDAEDDDGSTGTSIVDVTVLDDVPNDISPDAAVLGSGAGSAFTGDLDFFDNVGADKNGNVVFDPSLDDTQLLQSDGVTPITSNGFNIYTQVSGDGHTLTAYADVDGSATVNAGDTVVFTVVLNPDAVDEGDDEYTMTLFDQIDTGASLTFDEFPSGGAGHREWLGLDGPGDQDLLITPTNVGTTNVNNDADDIGVDDQWVDNGDVLRLDYVTGLNTGADFSDASTISYTGHYTVNNAGFTLIQHKAGGSLVDANVRAYDADDDNDFGEDPLDDIISVQILDENKVDVTAAFLLAGDITFELDGSVTILNLGELYQVFVSTADGFNRLEIENVDPVGNNDFVLGGFEVETFQAGDPIDMNFDVIAEDEDGDTSTGTIDVTVLPQMLGTSGADTLTANANGNDLVGGDGNDTLVGSDADDKLQGGNGIDTISDGDGNDIIFGGNGADIVNLAADGDTDILVYDAISEAGDVVTGFDVAAPVLGGAGGDIIDLVDLLDSGTFTGTTLGEAIADGYVSLVDNAGDAEIMVDLDGAGGGGAVLLATLNGVNIADLADNIVVD